MSAERVAEIERLLQDAFAPVALLVKDQSHLHAGHEGAKDGRGHFDVTIVSDRFDGQSRLSRHRMIYAALGSLMASDIHALRINATAPSDS
ncbi:MAG: BolA family transcriptional regulator [Proteobacteria bacterium]|nr:BolA family transcriptional regulator [Pseudomonadota bacterium]